MNYKDLNNGLAFSVLLLNVLSNSIRTFDDAGNQEWDKVPDDVSRIIQSILKDSRNFISN